MSKYMLTLLLAGCVPFFLSFWPGFKFYRHLRSLLKSIVLIVLIFGLWDIFATFRRHWSFNPEGVWSLRIVNLPLEEWLFFIVIPFCCIFTWEAMHYIKKGVKK